MVSSCSPPIVCLTDDDDDNNPTELSVPFTSSYASVANDSLPRKKRRLPETDTGISSTIINWSKRQRNDHYSRDPLHYNSIFDKPETLRYNNDRYHYGEPEKHSFHAFDWTADSQTSTKTYSNSIQTAPRIPIVPAAPTVMNVVKHHLDHSDTIPILPFSHQDDRYAQHSHTQSVNFPSSRSPSVPISLPLPTPTLSIVRPQAQRHPLAKASRTSYSHTTPPIQSTPIPVHQPIKSASSLLSPYPSSSHTTVTNSTPNPDILRQPLNGSSVLTAFFDSKSYRCNVCKFIAITSSKLLQHLFTHIFFCHQCSFYSFSQHSLYQHIYEKHPNHAQMDNINPKQLDLLYITRCADGTFALCMDSSSPSSTTASNEKSSVTTTVSTKPKAVKEKTSSKSVKEKIQAKLAKQKSRPIEPSETDVIVASEKSKSQPSTSSPVTLHRQPSKEKQASTYVLMKHRRCFLTRHPPCLHSSTLEYNICREHTIRHMCRTPMINKRRKIPAISNKDHFINQVAICLKTIVNQIVQNEESSAPSDFIYSLPNTILETIFPTDDLHTITNILKLTNKHEKSIEQEEQNQLESTVRSSNQHVFILASNGINKNDQSIFSSLYTSTKSVDSPFTHTKLFKLPISRDNTHRFLKGTLQVLSSSTSETNPQSLQRTNSQSPNALRRQLTTNDSLPTSNGRTSPTSNVIVID